MNAITFFITLLLLAAGASADQCTASASAAPRRGSAPWTSNGVTYTIYDITIVNTGSCDINTLAAYFAYPAGNTIASTFNYESASGAISGFGGSIASGATYNGAGFILAGSGTPTSAFIRPSCSCPTVVSTPTPRGTPTVAATPAPSSAPVSPTARPILATVRPTDAPTSSNCFQSCSDDEVCAALDVSGYSCHPRECKNLDCGSNVCINDGGVARCIISATLAPTTAPVPVATSAPTPATSAPTPATSAPAPATSAPVATSAPTDSATCSVSMSLVPRANGEFNDANGVANKMWDLVFTNKGASAVSGLQITFTAGTTVAQKWNLAQVGSSLSYDVLTYKALNTNGAEYHGSGFVISGSKAAPSIAVVATCA